MQKFAGKAYKKTLPICYVRKSEIEWVFDGHSYRIPSIDTD